jgi:hypothetical protein
MPKKVQELQPWGYPHVTELDCPVAGIKKTKDRHGWIKGVNLDGRLSERARRILTRLMLYLNLKTQLCNPTLRNLAMNCGLGEDDSAIRATRRALEEGEKRGWIRRHLRYGGSSRYNQSSQFEFLVPEAVTPAGLAVNVKLRVVGKDGRWFVTQVGGGVEICGPFKAREAAETWMMEHGLPESRPDKLRSRPDKIGVPTGQNRGPDRTVESGLNSEYVNSEYLKNEDYENPVLTYCRSDERHRPADSNAPSQRHSAGSIKNPGGRDNPAGSKQGPPLPPREAAPPSPPPPDIEALAETVRGGRILLAPLLDVCAWKPMTLDALIQHARKSEPDPDVAGFLVCGAVYREGDLIYPVGCERKSDGSYELPHLLPF